VLIATRRFESLNLMFREVGVERVAVISNADVRMLYIRRLEVSTRGQSKTGQGRFWLA
jgi:hypothetical protein